MNAKSLANDTQSMLQSVDQIFSFTSRNDTYSNSYNVKLIQATTSVYYNNTQMYFNTATTALTTLNSQLASVSSSTTTTRTAIQMLQDQEKTLLNALSLMVDN